MPPGGGYCNIRGFLFTMNVYLIKLSNDNEEFYKIGTTVHRYCRFYEIMKSGYEVEIIYMIHGLDWTKALDAESYLQSKFIRYHPLVKFGGYTECFRDINILTYKKIIHSIISNYTEITINKKITWR